MDRKTIVVVLFVAMLGLACFNRNNPQNITAQNRFEVTTASVVLGARQLLVDTSNGDVWVLDGNRSPEAKWVLLTRGPDDLRTPPPMQIPQVPTPPE